MEQDHGLKRLGSFARSEGVYFSSEHWLAKRTFLAVGILVAALAIAGCDKEPPPDPPRTRARGSEVPEPATVPVNEEELERLRSLGYLDTTDLPKLGAGEGAELLDVKLASPGYTLVVFAGTCTCELLSLEGKILRSWKDEPCHRWEHAELLPDGDLVVVGMLLDEDTVEDPIQTGRYVMRLSWDGEVRWRREINAHHDVSLTADGRLLTLVLERRRIPAIDPDNDVADDLMTWLSPDGQVVEAISLYDVISSSKIPFPFQRTGGRENESHRLIDLFHCNSIRSASLPGFENRSPIYSRNALLLTSRHQDELIILDWRTRQLLWHWGRGVLSGPHEASVLANGNILVFDNGLSRGWSRVLELDPLAPGRPIQFAPSSSRFFSRVMGSCQRLPNGNTLIVHSEGGAAFELTPSGTPAWTYEGTQQRPDGHRVKLSRMRRLPAQMVEDIIARLGPRTSPAPPEAPPRRLPATAN